MRRRSIFIAAATVLLLTLGSGLWVAQSEWLRLKIQAAILAQIEKSTGGTAELTRFSYDWRSLTVTFDGLTLHGRESKGDAPLLVVSRILLHLRVVSLLHGDVHVDGVEADRPQIHLIVNPDGRTNLPGAKTDSGRTRQQILDLRIGRFNARNGSFQLDSPGQPPRSMPWNASGEDLLANVNYEGAADRYTGDLSVGHLRILATDLKVEATGLLDRKGLLVTRAMVKSPGSEFTLSNAVLSDFQSHLLTAQYQARISLREAASLFRMKLHPAGDLNLTGRVTFASFSSFSVSGLLSATGVDVEKLHKLRLQARLDLSPVKGSLTAIHLNGLGAEATGSVETNDFKTFRATANVAHLDLREAAQISTARSLPYDALISGPIEAQGSAGHLTFNTHLNVSPAGPGPPVRGDVAIQYDSARAKINVGDSWLELPHTRLNLSGTMGDHLNVKLESTDVSDLLPAIDLLTNAKKPAVGPEAFSFAELSFAAFSFNGSVDGPLMNAAISGHTAFRNATYQKNRIESFAGDITLSRASGTASHADLVYGGVHARGAGSVQLANWQISAASPLTATLEVTGANVASLLSTAGHKEVEVTGNLDATGRITGTAGNPLADAQVALTRGTIYSQPFDSISGRLQIVNRNEQSLIGIFVSGPKRVNITARFEHAGTQFPAGTLDFNLTSNTMALNQIALVRQRQPDIRGFGEFHADGTLSIGHDAKHDIEFNLRSLNADASANRLELGGRDLGDARFTARTKENVLAAHFDSDAAKAAIHGDATVQLSGDYPASGRLTFANAGLNALAALAVKASDARSLNFDGNMAGTISFSGPLRRPEQMIASFDIPHLEMHALPGSMLAHSLPDFALTNTAPLRASLAESVIHLESARFQAPNTNLTVDGSIGVAGQAPLNLRVQGNVNLALAQMLNPELTATGSVTLNATLRGGWLTPDFGGHATIRNGNFHFADFSNGLTGATGEIAFNGTHATIQSFSAESGGGKVDVTGFAGLTNGLLGFRVEAQAHEVRVRYPEGISSVSDASLIFAGTAERSETSGVITVRRISINPRSDAATILANSGAPVQTPAGRTSLAANMNLDVQISTAPDVSLQTSVTQSLQADANLRLRGTATNPALIGRINITQGEMVFFGNKYSINTGTISFLNPSKIDPILNIDLETKARGVEVILTVSGPMTKLNVTYRSDPPLQFSDVVALLATGRAPTGSTLAVGATGQSQNFQQLGASALIGQAIASPVAGRLQRFFGVSRLKIDPSLTGVTGSPEARLTIEQQVTPEILFTYITDVSSTSTQLIRVEWSFNRNWSAILIREENGYVGLDFAYRKRFK